MNERAGGRLAWSIATFATLAAVLTVVLLLLGEQTLNEVVFGFLLSGVVLSISYSMVGALVASRRPENWLGWVFLAVGLSQGVDSFATQYANYSLFTNPHSLPAGPTMAWFAGWTWAPGAGLLATLTLLLFPSGRPPSPRWRWVIWLVGVSITLMVVPTAIATLPMDFTVRATRPPEGFAFELQLIGLVLVIVAMLASVCSIVVRYRRAAPLERQQLKWLVCGGAITVLWATVIFIRGPQELGPFGLAFGLLTVFVVPPSIPVAAGIAIFRYHLYDIDLAINRAIVYGTLSAVLALVYAGGVFLAGGALRSVTGQEKNGLVVAISTLSVAAIFGPARARIQSFIDRRFYRRKYDAARTLETFSGKLRDEVDLDAMIGELIQVVGETVQPSHISLWLRRSVAWPP